MNRKINPVIAIAIVALIAAFAGAAIWIVGHKSIVNNMPTTKSEKEQISTTTSNKILSVNDQEKLEQTVFNAVEKETKKQNVSWDKKLTIENIDNSLKAVTGKWWAKDAWDWIAWKDDNGQWAVLVSTDGFDCKELEKIPNQYAVFFHSEIYRNWAPEEKYCYDHNAQPTTSGVIYKNDQFGFQLTLPKEWISYKVQIEPLTGLSDCKDCYHINLMMPTSKSDSQLAQEGLQDTETGVFHGYWPVFVVEADDILSWNNNKQKCSAGDESSCVPAPLGQNSQYGFSFVSPQEGPSDIKNLFFHTQAEIIKSFKILEK